MARTCGENDRPTHRRRRSDDARLVADLLRAQILQGEHRTGPLPMEDQLLRAYGVSRNAVREALDMLREEGVVERRQGAGTFVVARKAMHDFDRLRSVADSVRLGVDPRFEVIAAEVLPAPATVASVLGLDDGEPTVLLERLMFLDGVAFSIRSSWMTEPLAAPLLRADLSRHHFYTLVARTLGLVLTKGHLVIEAVSAGEGAAALLGVEADAPLFLMERTSYLADGRPFEFGFTRSRGDRVALVAEMHVDVTDGPADAVAERHGLVANGQPTSHPTDVTVGVTQPTSR